MKDKKKSKDKKKLKNKKKKYPEILVTVKEDENLTIWKMFQIWLRT